MSFGFASSYVALWIWAIFQGLLTLAVFRQVVQLERRVGGQAITGNESDQLSAGARAPKFSGIEYQSRQRIDLSIFDKQGGVILFLAARCSVCRRLARSFQGVPPERLPIVVAFCTGDEKESAKLGKWLGPRIPLLLSGAADAESKYRVLTHPTAVVLDGERKIRAHSGIRGIKTAQELVDLVAGSSPDYSADAELAKAGTASM